jgi:hypothetical protein
VAARVSAVQAAVRHVTSANARFTASSTPALSFTIGPGSLLF